ncbi:hypothetical protein [Streptomyces sp. NBC_00564]|uniref:hypothetical protein n=1 Tax=Streptomyces sp. NBC_00564 TaxID=2903663 RepID=UPI00352CFDFC|nr:hypothetical protein OG256_34740 [Streptomyces sp. NBC_00564]
MAENAARTDDQLRAVYQEICVSYRAIDDFRAKLLGFLPVVTGAGVGLLLGRDPGEPQPIWLPVGLFGAVVTLGLFAYEVHGIKKCAYLIDAGARLERHLEVYGQFAGRPHAVGGVVNEPFAAAVVYSAVHAGWVFLALAYFTPPWAAGMTAVLLFLLGVVLSLWTIAAMERDLWDERQYKREWCLRPGLRARCLANQRALPVPMPPATRPSVYDPAMREGTP